MKRMGKRPQFEEAEYGESGMASPAAYRRDLHGRIKNSLPKADQSAKLGPYIYPKNQFAS